MSDVFEKFESLSVHRYLSLGVSMIISQKNTQHTVNKDFLPFTLDSTVPAKPIE